MARKLLLILALAILLGLSVVVAERARLFQNPLKVPIQSTLFLFPITNDITSNRVVLPRAVTLTLMLGRPTTNVDAIERSVTVAIWTKGILIGNQTLNLEKSRAANWLDKQGLQAYFLFNLEDTFPAVGRACLRTNGTFEIAISNAPPSAGVWLQAAKLSGWDLWK